MSTTHDTDPGSSDEARTLDEREQPTRVATDPSLFGIVAPTDPETTANGDADDYDTIETTSSSSTTDSDPGSLPPAITEGNLGFKKNRLRPPKAKPIVRGAEGDLATQGELSAKASVEARALPKALQLDAPEAAVVIAAGAQRNTEPLLRPNGVVAPLVAPREATPAMGATVRRAARNQITTHPGEPRRERERRRRAIALRVALGLFGLLVLLALAILVFRPSPADTGVSPAPSQPLTGVAMAPPVVSAAPAPVVALTASAPASVSATVSIQQPSSTVPAIAPPHSTPTRVPASSASAKSIIDPPPKGATPRPPASSPTAPEPIHDTARGI
ncbi:hypothetical protein BH11MYX4_BH11MYX4_23140 [soil metagenome]